MTGRDSVRGKKTVGFDQPTALAKLSTPSAKMTSHMTHPTPYVHILEGRRRRDDAWIIMKTVRSETRARKILLAMLGKSGSDVG